jgi:phosphoglucosamine mutase
MPQVLLNLRVRVKTPLEELPDVMGVIGAVEERLGQSGRVLVRYSGTEKKVRVMVEGEDRAVIEALAAEIADALRAEIGEESE